MQRDVIIIGAGLGGLTCAASLAKAGLDVLLLEARSEVGGCCHTTEQSGFCFEDGALWLSMDYICREIFAELGADFDGLVPSVRLDPSTDCLLPGGERFRFSPNQAAIEAEIERFSPSDVPCFRRFMTEMASREVFVSGELYNNPMTWSTLLNPQLWRHAGFLLTSYGRVIRRTFRDSRVQLAFSRPTLFLGLPPSRCPAAFILSSYGEITSGSAYPLGGMGRIPAAVEGLFRGFGGTLLTGTEVEAIVLIDHRAIGVRLSDGETLQARAVVSNIHVQKSYLDLVGRDHLSRLAVRRMESLRFGHSYFGVQLGLDCQVRGAANTPVLPPLGELESFWAEVEERVPAHLCPNVAVVPVEAKVAPPGGSVVCVYHVAPLHPGPGGWAAAKEGLAERLLDSAEAATGLPVRRHVVTQRIRTPVDFEQQLRLPQGAMYGLSPTLLQSGPFRPRNRSPWIRSLYLVGQTTHPGLGVASVMASGATTARLVMQDLAGSASGQVRTR